MGLIESVGDLKISYDWGTENQRAQNSSKACRPKSDRKGRSFSITAVVDRLI